MASTFRMVSSWIRQGMNQHSNGVEWSYVFLEIGEPLVIIHFKRIIMDYFLIQKLASLFWVSVVSVRHC